MLHLIVMTIGMVARIRRSERDRLSAEHEAAKAARESEAKAQELVKIRTNELSIANDRLMESLGKEQVQSTQLHQFVDMISHEYRTPVAILRTNLDLLRASIKEPQKLAKDSFPRMERAISRLVEVLGDRLQLGLLEDGILKPIFSTYDPAKLLDQALLQIRDWYTDKTIVLKSVHNEATLSVQADGPLFKTALVNIIDNAIKYSDEGSDIEIMLKQHRDETEITVSNQGASIPQDDIERLFERSFRSESAASRPGVGVGLYLTKAIIELHNGQIELRNSNSGVTATIRLPNANEDGNVSAVITSL